MTRTLYLAAWAYLALCTATLLGAGRSGHAAAPSHAAAPFAASGSSGGAWFGRARPFCNPVEVVVGVRRLPPPPGGDGPAYLAACYALAGNIDRARAVIDGAEDPRYAAHVVFNVAHPVADAGDDEAAGPIMSLVLEYTPDNFMALYHAGISEHALGHPEAARRHLTEFVRLYGADDGFRGRALSVLRELGTAPDAEAR
ncbi:MAG TPA: hypothetical protein VHG91_18055 [Longimicrobium sp.]|nr:hypothetical protein [Longimicrobium sp.]